MKWSHSVTLPFARIEKSRCGSDNLRSLGGFYCPLPLVLRRTALIKQRLYAPIFLATIAMLSSTASAQCCVATCDPCKTGGKKEDSCYRECRNQGGGVFECLSECLPPDGMARKNACCTPCVVAVSSCCVPTNSPCQTCGKKDEGCYKECRSMGGGVLYCLGECLPPDTASARCRRGLFSGLRSRLQRCR